MTSSRRLRAFSDEVRPSQDERSPIVQNLYPPEQLDCDPPEAMFNREEPRVEDLPAGDAGAGIPAFRRIQTFTRLDDPTTFVVSDNPATRSLAMATYKSDDRRDRLLHISFYGTGVINDVSVISPRGPLPEGEILETGGFIGIEDSAISATTTSLVPFIPRISSVQGRVQIHDASGMRQIDLDVLGTRSLSVYAWSATVFALVPATGYEVVASQLANVNQNRQFGGLVEDSIFAARITPAFSNISTPVTSRTIMVNLTGTTDSECRIPIPPGSRKVTVINHSTTGTDLDYTVTFDIGAPVSGTRGTTGRIVIDATSFRTDAIVIPNSTSILIDALGTATPATYSFIFEVTA